MKQYLDLMQNVLEHGKWQENRTGIPTKMIPAAMLQFDTREGFPAVTTKKLAYKSVVGELLCFAQARNYTKDFNNYGCKVWDANANAPAWLANPNNTRILDTETGEVTGTGYLGRIYGVQWRDWKKADGSSFDQIEYLLSEIRNNPTSRRLLVSAWRPDELDQMALPPCHYAFEIIIEQETKTMHLSWNQRSCDVFLGLPFNIASYATLLYILARITGYTPGILTAFLADVHIYENHIDQCMEQLSREPLPLGKIRLSPRIDLGFDIKKIVPEDITLESYVSYPPIKADMAV